MRNRFSKKTNTVIELTSLLDVIFIVLMVVMCNQKINLTEQKQKVEVMQQEAIDAKADAEAEKALYEENRDTFESIGEQMDTLTIYVTYTPSNPEDREILVMKNTKELPRIQLHPGNADEALQEFSEVLEKHVSEAADKNKPVIVKVNTERILYRDEKSVKEIFDNLSEKHNNIFYRQFENE